jgi:hypothetical protein
VEFPSPRCGGQRLKILAARNKTGLKSALLTAPLYAVEQMLRQLGFNLRTARKLIQSHSDIEKIRHQTLLGVMQPQHIYGLRYVLAGQPSRKELFRVSPSFKSELQNTAFPNDMI